MAAVADLIRRGDIFLVDFGASLGGEVAYIRPAIVVTNNTANFIAHVIVVVPITSNIEKIGVYDVFLPNNRTDLNQDSKSQVNLIRHIAIERLGQRLGHVPSDLMDEVDARIIVHLGLQVHLGF
jgi:mRNA interferase MazF